MIGNRELYSEKNRNAKWRIPEEAISQLRVRLGAPEVKGAGTSSSEVRCCLWTVATCWAGLEGDVLSKQI